VTALGARDDRIRGLEAGADDFLTKPLDPNEVRCRVRTFLSLRQAQRGLKARAEELERLQKAKAELTSMIVHDLKNPLAAIGSNLSWIARRLRKNGVSDKDLEEALEDALGGSGRLLALVGSLIDVEKAESGQLQVERKNVRVHDILDGIARRHRKEAEARSIVLDIEVDPALQAALDEAVIARMLENLVENATRYAGDKGRIRLEGRSTARGLELVVENTGTPIPVEARAKIFDKHVSGEGKRSAHLGLGLYFCRLAARAHGGDIAVESTPTWPTRFVIRLAEARVASAKASGGAFLD
jgi:signal transduction histidine kinase